MSEEFSSIDEQASYGIGRQVGEQLAQQPFEGMSSKAVIAGIADVLEETQARSVMQTSVMPLTM